MTKVGTEPSHPYDTPKPASAALALLYLRGRPAQVDVSA